MRNVAKVLGFVAVAVMTSVGASAAQPKTTHDNQQRAAASRNDDAPPIARTHTLGERVPAPPIVAVLADDASSNLRQELDPTNSTTGAYAGCVKSTTYDTCIKHCDCGFANNKKTCNSSATCVDLATSEKNACYGGCITDFS